MNRMRVCSSCVVLLVAALMLTLSQVKSNHATYQTIAGTGPDKWAAVWLIRNYLNPDAVSVSLEESALSEAAISFDTDSSALTRTGSSTTYTAFLDAHEINDPIAIKLGKIIHDIEINAWNPNRKIESL